LGVLFEIASFDAEERTESDDKTKKPEFLTMARRIGDNVIVFVASKCNRASGSKQSNIV
jgi:hypothetical protein